MTGGRILVIDDEGTIRNFLELTLTAQGYEVLEASNGKDGLKKITSDRPDLVILDLSLPDMDGRKVLEQVRAWSRTPFIVLTVKDSDSDKVALLDTGADDYLTKPFSVPELLARIRTAIRHSNPHLLAQIFKFGPLEIELDKRTVKLRGKLVKLTSTEFQLLEVLVRNAGKVITQRQLLKEVWGANATEQSHYLRIYIGQLRKKLDGPELEDLIATEPGVGYRLRSPD